MRDRSQGIAALPERFQFNTEHVVYSRYGSYLSVTLRQDRLLLQSMHGGLEFQDAELFVMTVIDGEGNGVPFEIHLRADRLRLSCTTGTIDLCCAGKDDLILQGSNAGLRLARQTTNRLFDYSFSPDGIRWEVNAFESGIKAGLRTMRGKLNVEAPWNQIRSDDIAIDFLPDEQGVLEGQIHLYESVWLPDEQATVSLDAATEESGREFATWLDTTLQVPERWHKGREVASYINWSSVIAPHGFHKRPAMLMSKDLMNMVWSWDHCFNALALARQNAPLAWDQFVLFFDHQHAQGAIPDFMSDSSRSFGFNKPPIHGWALRKLMQISDVVNATQLRAIYAPLARWTEWWLTYRDDDRDGLPQYNHGNESGWDNGTVFTEGVPVESPDLCAYLVVQMDVLAEIASRLGKPNEAITWAEKASDLFARMIAELWTGKRFMAKHANTHAIVGGDSALMLIPLILGERLPDNVRISLVAELRRFITKWGIPSEHPESVYYEADGYWRGPIWAPPTYLIVDGLLGCNEHELALEISHKFCDMATHSGMAENYDALTGAGLRDRSYTWTASVFLLLGNLVLQAEA